jgi:hypothetical protein
MVKSAAQQLRANNYKKGDLQYGLSVGDIIINWARLSLAALTFTLLLLLLRTAKAPIANFTKFLHHAILSA